MVKDPISILEKDISPSWSRHFIISYYSDVVTEGDVKLIKLESVLIVNIRFQLTNGEEFANGYPATPGTQLYLFFCFTFPILFLNFFSH